MALYVLVTFTYLLTQNTEKQATKSEVIMITGFLLFNRTKPHSHTTHTDKDTAANALCRQHFGYNMTSGLNDMQLIGSCESVNGNK